MPPCKRPLVQGPRGRAAKKQAAAKAAPKMEAKEETGKIEEFVVRKNNNTEEATTSKMIEVKEEISEIEEFVVEKSNNPKEASKVENKVVVSSQSEPSQSLQVQEEKPYVAVQEDEKGERLDLDDEYDTDYDPEEVDVDYDEKGIEKEQSVEEEKGEEEDGGEGEEDDMEEEQMEDVCEEIEDDGVEENIEEEREELVDEEHEEVVDGEDEELVDGHHKKLVAEHEYHKVVKERRKRKKFEVFVGGLDKNASEDDLKKVFSAVGEIVEIRLMVNPQTKKNKGFAFLRFATVEQAERAVKEMKNPVVNGKQCGVTPIQNNDTLFLGNICKTWTKEDLKKKLKQYGIDYVEDLTLAEDNNNAGMNRGFAFLEFSSRSNAMYACKRLQKRDVVFGVDKNAKVSFAKSFTEPEDETMAQVKTVFVDGLSASWDENRVKEQFKKFGEIENVELARNIPSARRKDYGFITFYTHDNAVVCAESINNAELSDGDNKVKVRARLARPLTKGRGKVPSHGCETPRGGGTSRIKPSTQKSPVRGPRGEGRFANTRARRFKGLVGLRDRRPFTAVERVRPLPPPSRSYNKKPDSSYPRSSSKKDFVRRDVLPPRSRDMVDFYSRADHERQSSYKIDYAPRESGCADDVPRASAQVATRRLAYVDESYEQRVESPPPSYREGRFDLISGSKRSYSTLEDVLPCHPEVGVYHSRTRLKYGVGVGSSEYANLYNERIRRPHLEYSGNRTQGGHRAYDSRYGASYDEDSYSDSEVGGAYLSTYASDYMSQRSDVGDGTYPSIYSSRTLGGSNYLGGSGSGSYY